MNPLFWQHVLAIDPSGTRFRDLIEGLGTSSFDPLATLLADRRLTDGDRKRLSRLDTRKIGSVFAGGATIEAAAMLGANYPSAPGAAPVLTALGTLRPFDEPMIAIVGTRKASAYGKAAAMKFADMFARAGVTVVSGGAFGIDSAAHLGALDAGGKTVAVLGTGIDICYPAANKELFERVKENGCLLSQFAVGTPSLPENFLHRNYSVAALADAVLVVEAPEKSGALSTARHCAELGKEVFVLPGPITLESFRGSHGLIRDGAQLVDHPDQVLESLGLEAGIPQSAVELPEIQEAILEALSSGSMSAERLSETTGLDASDILNELTMLELDGLIIRDVVGYSKKP